MNRRKFGRANLASPHFSGPELIRAIVIAPVGVALHVQSILLCHAKKKCARAGVYSYLSLSDNLTAPCKRLSDKTNSIRGLHVI